MDWLDWWQASDHSLHSSGGWRDQSNRWDEASDCSLHSSGGWWTGQTDDDRHLISHCVHLVDDWLVRLMMTGILSFIAFIWWMMRLVRLMMCRRRRMGLLGAHAPSCRWRPPRCTTLKRLLWRQTSQPTCTTPCATTVTGRTFWWACTNQEVAIGYYAHTQNDNSHLESV